MANGMETERSALLEVKDLHVEFHTHYGTVNAVNGIDFSLQKGETLGVLGESGSGKSVSFQAIMGLIPRPPGVISGNCVNFNGRNILNAPERVMQKVRGDGIAMVFQDALTSLNPGFTVGYQIGEVLRLRRKASKQEAWNRSLELMKRVNIPSAENRIRDYPHQFSGGMRQRVMIALALTLDPEILIADEPTTALDVTVQRQIMDLLSELQNERKMSLVLITHDLAVLAENANHVVVMYAGNVVEKGPVDIVFSSPAHPYTIGLMKSIPHMHKRKGKLNPIMGAPPVLSHIPKGCAFHPRCEFRKAVCMQDKPVLHEFDGTRGSACHFFKEVMHG